MHLSDWKGWSQDPPFPSPHLRVGSGGKCISLVIPAYLRLSEAQKHNQSPVPQTYRITAEEVSRSELTHPEAEQVALVLLKSVKLQQFVPAVKCRILRTFVPALPLVWDFTQPSWVRRGGDLSSACVGSNLPATTERIPTKNGCLHQPLCLVLGNLPVFLSLQHRAQHLQHYLGELQLLKKQRAVLAQLWGAGTAQHCQQCVELQDLFLLAYPDPSTPEEGLGVSASSLNSALHTGADFNPEIQAGVSLFPIPSFPYAD
ncbi:uncharacterized protein LOC419335 [Gallus gallus]|uniref:uncharacterized protein LOC419335 n=1 Tax=Gallus gallus TaxID=9031 RepID=UPI001F02E2E6|nr:uncharacterized protein LOC419335 [Gallus gallus]